MKKFVALLLGSAMAVSAIAGLAACGPKKQNPNHEHVDAAPQDGKCDVCGQDMTSPPSHTSHPDVDFDGYCDIGEEKLTPSDPVPSITRAADPRTKDAYTVYDGQTGEEVGGYPSVAQAIEAAIENDLDYFEDEETPFAAKGSYVTLKGSDTKLFRNQLGYSNAKGDLYYYYQNHALVGVEVADSTLSRVAGKDWIAYRVSYGTEGTQPQNGFKLLDGKGNPLSAEQTSAIPLSRGWEFFAHSDASFRAVPVRDAGATGSRYTVDLSNVKITPPYAGVQEKTYAYIGFWIGATGYGFELGIACDTTTGNWYTYCSHAPGEKSQVYNNYDLGELVMTSTWDAAAGCFKPDSSSLSFELIEKRETNEFNEPSWYNSYTMKTDKKTYTYRIDEDFISDVCGGGAFQTENGFFFTAGLDVVAPDAEVGDDLPIVDYTNGSAFENLVITQSEVYFPTRAELEDNDYPSEIDPSLRGKWFSTYTDFEGVGKGVYDYTIVNTAACVTSDIKSDKSTWSFSYKAPATAPTQAVAGELKTYQDKIDTLKQLTEQNAYSYKDTIAEVGALYANGNADISDLQNYIYLAVDWDVFLKARETYYKGLENALSAEAKALMGEIEALPSLKLLFKGYKMPEDAPEGTAKTDYLYNTVFETYAALKVKYDALSEDDKEIFPMTEAYNTMQAWQELYDELDELVNGTFGTTSYQMGSLDMTKVETLTGAQIIESLFECVYNVGFGNGDEKVHVLYAGGGMDPNKGIASFRILFIREFLKEHEVTLGYLDDAIELLCVNVDANSYDGHAYIHDFENYLYPVMKQIARILTGDCTYLDEELAEVVNTNMLNFRMTDPCLRFNFGDATSSGNLDGGNYGVYFGENVNIPAANFRKVVQDTIFEIIKRDSPDTAFGTNGISVTSEVEGLTEDPLGQLSTEVQGLIDSLNALPNIAALSTVTDGSKVLEGLTTYAALQEKYTQLTVLEKAAVARYAYDPTGAFAAYKKLGDDLNALDNTTEITVKALSEDGKTVADPTQMTAQAIVRDFIAVALNKCNTGFFCLSHNDNNGHHVPQTMRAYYLYELMKKQKITCDFVDEIVAAIQADANGATAWEAVSTVWPVLGQVARVEKKEVAYLDETMATVLNAALENRTSVTFANGDWNGYWYNQGDVNPASKFVWTYYIDDVFTTWTPIPTLMEKLGTIIERDGNGVKLVKSGNYYGFKLSGHLVGLTEDPTKLTPELTEFVEKLNALTDITDLSKVTDGSKILEGLAAYAELQNEYEALAEADQNKIIGASFDPTALFTAYKTLDDQLKALDKENKITVKVLGADKKPTDSTQMTQAELVKAFITEALHPCATDSNRYLCTTQDAYAVVAYTAYYHYTLIESNNVECEIVDDIMTMLQSDTWSRNVLKDFSDLWAILGQVARIVKAPDSTYLDAEMAKVINEHMVNRDGAYSNGLTAYNSEWNWDMTGGNGFFDIPRESHFAWTYYIDDALWTGTWQSIPSLLEKLGKIIERDGNGVTLKKIQKNGEDKCYGLMVTGEVAAVTEPQKKD